MYPAGGPSVTMGTEIVTSSSLSGGALGADGFWFNAARKGALLPERTGGSFSPLTRYGVAIKRTSNAIGADARNMRARPVLRILNWTPIAMMQAIVTNAPCNQSLMFASAAAASGIYVSRASMPAINKMIPSTPNNPCAIFLVTAAIARIGTNGINISISCIHKTPGRYGQGAKFAFSSKNIWAQNNGRLIKNR